MKSSNTKKGIKSVANKFWGLSIFKKIIILGILLAVIWFGVKPLFSKSNSQKIEYITEIAEKGTLINSVTATGVVSSTGNANITSNATGVVSEVYVKNGDTVSEGDTIAIITLDSASLQKQTAAWANYLSAQNSLNSAKSRMNSLQSALFTANRKFVNGTGVEDPDTDDPNYIIQRADWLQAESDYNNQQGVINAAEANLSSAWLSYSQTSSTITAPITGIVSNLSLSQGASITGNSSSESDTNSSQTLGSITLADSKPQATVNLTEIDITKVAIGQKVTMTLDAFSGKTFTGKVTAINTTGTTSSGVTVYPVTITYDTVVDKMYSNMAVSSTIITKIKNNVLLVPSAAVTTLNEESSVRIMKNGKPATTTVAIGESNDSQTEIISGLNEGDVVVTGQTGGVSTTSTRTSNGVGTSASPFGASGFGGGTRAGATSGNRVFIQQR